MNIRLLAKLLGILSALIGAFMLFSLPWAVPGIGRHTSQFEQQGFSALVIRHPDLSWARLRFVPLGKKLRRQTLPQRGHGGCRAQLGTGYRSGRAAVLSERHAPQSGD